MGKRVPQQGIWSDRGGRLYVLTEVLGEGAHGTVYKALRSDGPPCAVKELSDPGDRQAYAAEFARLLLFGNVPETAHPNVVGLRDGFEHRGSFFLVLELCDGSLVDLLLGATYVGNTWLVPVARDVLAALDWIHECGSVHGDVATTNVFFLTGPGGPSSYVFKLGDFGYGNRWVPVKGPERPELLLADVRAATQLLLEVANGGLVDDPDAFLNLHREPWAAVLRRALCDEFGGEGGMRTLREEFLRAAGVDPATVRRPPRRFR